MPSTEKSSSPEPRYAYTRCAECEGTGGWIPITSGPEECEVCHGTGLVRIPHPDGDLIELTMRRKS